MDVIQTAITVCVGVGGVGVGAWLSRRNEKRAHGHQLLVAALSDAVEAIADVAGGQLEAQRRYAGAVSRIALYGPPGVVAAFRRFQDEATTGTSDGRERFVAAVQAARSDLDLKRVRSADISVLLFGASQPIAQASPTESASRPSAASHSLPTHSSS